MEQPDWYPAAELLAEMDEDLPPLEEARLDNLKSTGSTLCGVLRAAELEQGDWLDEITWERSQGVAWPEDLTPVQILCLKLRFDWARSVLEGLRHCGFQQVPEDLALKLVTDGWNDGGFSHSHENFLQSHLLELLADTDEPLGEPGE